jgi:hypothetical protein
MKGGPSMSDNPRENNDELDCSVTIYDGSWMTCDMIEEETDAEA